MKKLLSRFFLASLLILVMTSCGTQKPNTDLQNEFTPDTDLVIPTGGMMIVPPGKTASDIAKSLPALSPQATPSCKSVTFTGNSGYVSYQVSPSGYLAWGIYLFNKSEEEDLSSLSYM